MAHEEVQGKLRGHVRIVDCRREMRSRGQLLCRLAVVGQQLTFGVGERSMAQLALGIRIRAPSCNPVV